MKNELPTLPNGLPLWKLMQYTPTKEQCRIVKVNEPIIDVNPISSAFGKIIVPLTVNIRIIRKTLDIEHAVIIENILPYDLIVWTESMSPHKEVTYRTKKKQARTVYYN